jgi:hypothetical protein
MIGMALAMVSIFRNSFTKVVKRQESLDPVQVFMETALGEDSDP